MTSDNVLTYELPGGLIAQEPLADRSASRLMVLDRARQTWCHRRFDELGEFLRPGDCLVLNDTRVVPARLLGRRLPNVESAPRLSVGGTAELLLLHPGPRAGTYWCLSRPARRLPIGACVSFNHGSLTGQVIERGRGPERLVRFETTGDLAECLEAVGQVPLPPYIRRPPTADDRIRYQTVYAARPGAVAAPTAGLHFTEPLLEGLQRRGITVATLTLHVGYGTFKPVAAEELASGRLHAEWYDLPPTTAEVINVAKARGNRIIAVGTTTCRVLETCAAPAVQPRSGWTELFIRPGFAFRIVDALITNFHLPGTSLLMLAAAFAGTEFILNAYEAAIAERYRFYSYGDAMLII